MSLNKFDYYLQKINFNCPISKLLQIMKFNFKNTKLANPAIIKWPLNQLGLIIQLINKQKNMQ